MSMPSAKSEDVLSASPELLQLRTQWYRTSLGLKFGLIYRKLGLSPQQIAAVENVMTEQYQGNMEARSAAVAQGVSPSDTALVPLMKPIAAKTGKDLADILGADGSREFSAYIKAHTGRTAVVDPLAGNLYYTDAPLTLAQADRLTEIIAGNTGGLKQTGLVYSPAETKWDAVLIQAQSVLTAAQFATFRAMRETEALQKQMNDLSAALLRDAQAKTNGAVAAKPKS